MGTGPGNLSAMPAGERKMPEPMVDPITTAIALQSPRRRSRVAGGGVAFIRRKYAAGLPPARGAGDNSPMPAVLIAVLFWSATAAVVVAQVMILRSSARVLRAAAPERPVLEWTFAVGPALVLALVLFLSWRATMAPPSVEIELPTVPGEIRS